MKNKILAPKILALCASALLAVLATPAHANHIGNNDDSFSFEAPQPVTAAEAPAVQKEEINFDSNPNDPIDIQASLDATARPTEIAPPPPEVIVAPAQPEQPPQVISPRPQDAPVRPKWEKPVYIR